MSFLTTIVVIAPTMPVEVEDRLLTEAADADGGTLLRKLTFDPAGRDPLLHVYGATYNHFADSEFMDWLSGLPWQWPGGWPWRHEVRVIAHNEYSDIAPRVLQLTDTGWTDNS